MGKAINVRKNFKALGYRSPHWQIYNFFANKIGWKERGKDYIDLSKKNKKLGDK